MHTAAPKSLLRWLALVCALVAGLASGASAQAPFKFDPARDLEGFEDRFFSEFADVYALAKYEKLKGKEIPPEELAKLREEWKVERAAGDEKVKALKADPRETWLHSLRLDLKKHPFFKDVQWVEDASFAPFLLFVQQPLGAEEGYATKVSQSFGPPLQKLGELFKTSFAQPLGLKPNERGLVYPIFVLQSEMEYRDFSGKTDVSPWGDGPVTYIPRMRLVVGAATPESSGAVSAREMRPILRAAMQMVLDAYSRGGKPIPLWIAQGFSNYLSHRETMPDGSLAPVIEPEDVSQFVRASQQPDRAELLLYPIEDLAQPYDVRDVENLVKNRSEMIGMATPGHEDMLHFFDLQSTLWVHYLRDGRNGRNRGAFDKYLVSALSGRSGLPDLFAAFQGTDMAELDTDFVRFTFQQHKKLLPNEKLEIADGAEKIFVDRAIARGASSSSTDASAEPLVRSIVPSSSAPFQPQVLAVPEVDVEAMHGLSLVKAREGDLDGALKQLKALQATSPQPPMDMRIARDIERIEQTSRLRLAYLDYLRTSGGMLSVDQRGMKFETGVTKVENGEVLLAANKLGVSKISLESLTPFQVARQAGSKEKQGGTEAWVRFYPYILAGDNKWEKLLKDDSPKAKELRTDATTWISDLVRVGEASATLNKLANTPDPQSAKEINKVLDMIGGLVSRDHDLRVVQDKLLDLKQIAAVLIMKSYQEKDPGALAHGQYRFLGNGLANILYDFTDPAEGSDFVKHEGYLPFWRKGLTATLKSEQESTWAVKNGEFYGVGSACYRHFLSFTAPITLRYDLRFDLPQKDPKTAPFFMVAVCDDALASFASCHNFSGINIVDMKSGFRTEVQSKGESIQYKRVYQFEIRHDGKMLSLTVDGEKKAEAEVGERQTGAVMLWFSTDYPVAILKLEIEGKIDPQWADRAKTDHLKGRLSDLGFR